MFLNFHYQQDILSFILLLIGLGQYLALFNSINIRPTHTYNLFLTKTQLKKYIKFIGSYQNEVPLPPLLSILHSVTMDIYSALTFLYSEEIVLICKYFTIFCSVLQFVYTVPYFVLQFGGTVQ